MPRRKPNGPRPSASAVKRAPRRKPTTGRRRPRAGGTARWPLLGLCRLLGALGAAYVLVAIGAAGAILGYLIGVSGADRPSLLLDAAVRRAPAAAPEAIRAPRADETAVTFVITPSIVGDGWTRIPADRSVTVIGSAPGAAQAEFLVTPTGTGTADLERLMGAENVAEDGSFIISVRLPPGLRGQARVNARASDGSTFSSERIGIISE